jgi:hypothetical protein
VTHSLGGIITRLTLNHPGCPDEAKIGKAALMAPPNQGSSFGRFLGHFGIMQKFLGPKTGKELLTHTNFDHIGEFPETKKVLIVAGNFGFNPVLGGANDGKVLVSETELNTPHEHAIYFVGHSWIMYDTKVMHKIRAFVKSD